MHGVLVDGTEIERARGWPTPARLPPPALPPFVRRRTTTRFVSTVSLTDCQVPLSSTIEVARSWGGSKGVWRGESGKSTALGVCD